MSKATDRYFKIQAKSIVMIGSAKPILTLVIFKPTKDTMKRLRALEAGQKMGPISLVDDWDDGTKDTHMSDDQHSFIALTGSGSAVKTSAYTLLIATPFAGMLQV